MWVLSVMILLMSSHAWAGNLQYIVATGHITGISDEPVSTPSGYAVVTIAESVTAIQWPVPAGCEAGEGQWDYTRVDDPGTVAVDGTGLEVRGDLALFGTSSTLMPGCFNAGDRRRLVNLAIGQLLEVVQEQELALALNAFNVMAARRCPGTSGGANCDTVRANMSSLDAFYPTAATLANVTTELVTLRADVSAFITGQCTTNPGGPFCVP